MTTTLDTLQEAIKDGDEEQAAEITRQALDEGIEPKKAIKSASKVLGEVGDKYDAGEYFLFDLVASGDAMNASRQILEDAIHERGEERDSEGKVVLGTVEGDIHDIGKKILGSVLTARGYEVFDLGVEVPAADFVEKIAELDADAVGASALLTTTKEKQRDLVETLEAEGLRDDVVVMVGGAPCTEDWKTQIGADLYAENAFEAARKLETTLTEAPTQ